MTIIPDNDHTGEAHTVAGARSCIRGPLRVRIARLPGLPPVRDKHGEDISDWLDAEHTIGELLVVEADSEENTKESFREASATDDVETHDPQHLLRPEGCSAMRAVRGRSGTPAVGGTSTSRRSGGTSRKPSISITSVGIGRATRLVGVRG